MEISASKITVVITISEQDFLDVAKTEKQTDAKSFLAIRRNIYSQYGCSAFIAPRDDMNNQDIVISEMSPGFMNHIRDRGMKLTYKVDFQNWKAVLVKNSDYEKVEEGK